MKELKNVPPQVLDGYDRLDTLTESKEELVIKCFVEDSESGVNTK